MNADSPDPCADLTVPSKEKSSRRHTGRKPFTFTPEEIAKVEEMAGRGLNEREIFLNLGLKSYQGWIDNKKRYTELSEALARGKASMHNILSNALTMNALTPTKMMPYGNVEAQKFILARRYGWTEAQAVPEGATLERVTFERIRPDGAGNSRID